MQGRNFSRSDLIQSRLMTVIGVSNSVNGICTLFQKMASFFQFFTVRVKVSVRVRISGDTFSVKRVFEQV